jgi:glycosyltransferase involved in cell wall biosynthesis
MRNKKVSIITVVYNRKEDLEITIESVLSEKTEEVEFIVIDGESTDGSVQLMDKHEAIIDVAISEPDGGIFDAMNKGIRLATGKWLIFINAGDELIPGCLDRIDFAAYKDCGIIYGNTERSSEGVTRPFLLRKIESGSMPACHQSTLYNKDVLKEELYYNLTYPLFGENELMMRVYVKGVPIKYVDEVISKFQGGGISASVDTRVRKARYFFLLRHFGVIGVIRGVMHKLGLINYPRV